MASSYGGVSFRTIAEEEDNTLKRPLLVPEDFGVQRQKVPYSNFEVLQITGRTNPRMTLKIELYDATDFDSLLAMVGTGTARSLVTEWGDTLTNMYLVDAKNMWRVSFAEEYHADLTFEHIGP